MRANRLVSALTLLAFLAASAPRPAVAGPADGGSPGAVPQASALRQSIDRASTRAASQFPRVPERAAGPVRKQMTGGGGGGMMMMTLLVTAASLAGTYFLVKELKKTTDEANSGVQ